MDSSKAGREQVEKEEELRNMKIPYIDITPLFMVVLMHKQRFLTVPCHRNFYFYKMLDSEARLAAVKRLPGD